MKKTISILLLGCVTFLAMNTYAGVEECSPKDVHCAYFTGSDLKSGKYVKFTDLNHNQSSVICTDVGGAASILQEYVDGNLYKPGELVRDMYAQCKNAACAENISLGLDQFRIIDAGNGYTSAPQKYEVRMSGTYGEDCNPDLSSNNFKSMNINQQATNPG